MMYDKFLSAKLGLQGRFIIRVFFLMTNTTRLKAAFFVHIRLFESMAWAVPKTFLSATARVASGVISFGESPVLPVVIMRSAVFSSHIFSRSSWRDFFRLEEYHRI